MGVECVRQRCFFSVLVLLVFFVCFNECHPERQYKNEETKVEEDINICDIVGCNCTSTHKYWNEVNCTLDKKQEIELHPGSLPKNVIELSISGGKHIRFNSQSFSTLTNFQRLRIEGTSELNIKVNAFLNLTVNSLLVQVLECNSVVLDTAAFRNMKGSITLEVTRCGYVLIQRSAFSFLQYAAFTDIPRLELAEEAFTLVTRDLGHHGAVTTIRFHKVMIPILPRDVFKSSLAEISLVESEVLDVLENAFSGNTIAAVHIANSSLHRVRAKAFSERTQLDNLALTGCRVHLLEGYAIRAALTNLTVQYSNITTLEANAVDAIVASLVFHHNTVDLIKLGGITIRDWSLIFIESNIFGRLAERSFDVSNSPPLDSERELSFSDNIIDVLDSGALMPIGQASRSVTRSKIVGNKFGHTCHCDIRGWLDDTVGENTFNNFVADNYCTVDLLLAQCYNLNDSVIVIKNFTDVYCSNSDSADGMEIMECKTFEADANVGIKRPFGTANGDDNDDKGSLILGLVLGLVLLIAVCGTIVILLIHGGLWLKRKGYCVRFKNFNYRIEEGSTEAEDIMVSTDKTPDNLPEELTPDLLQMLREKLEDPTTYNEAREMIERLYDHFIIEDSSYTNNNRQDEETHLYEELGNLQHQNGAIQNGRAIQNTEQQQQQPTDEPLGMNDKLPSPDQPFNFLRLIEERFNLITTTPSVLADEYSEPTDAEVHLYSELPAQNSNTGKEGRQNQINEVLTRTLTPPLVSPSPNGTHSSTSSRMAYRPLPPQPDDNSQHNLHTAVCTVTTVLHDPGEGPSSSKL